MAREPLSNQWEASATKTASTEASSSGICSAVPATVRTAGTFRCREGQALWVTHEVLRPEWVPEPYRRKGRQNSRIEYLLWRHALADGELTTMYAVRYPRRAMRARVVHFPQPERLDVWCRRDGVEEAVVGGFFLRDPYRPLGELWIDGRPAHHEPVAAPYAARRGSVVIDDGDVRLMERSAAPAQPRGDLVQAGPLLVVDGTIVFDADDDR